MTNAVLEGLRWAIRGPVMAALLYILAQRRYTAGRSMLILAACTLAYVAGGLWLMDLLPQFTFYRLMLAGDILWCVLAGGLISAKRGTYPVFLGLTVTAFTEAAGSLCVRMVGHPLFPVLNLVMKLAAYSLLIFILYRFFRVPYREFADQVTGGWLFYAAFPLAYELYLDNLVAIGYAADHYGSVLLRTVLLTAMLSFYYAALYRLFGFARRQRETAEQNEMLQTNLKAIRSYEARINELYDSIRTYRHDIKHYVTLMTRALPQGPSELRDMLERLEGMVDAARVAHSGTDLSLNSLLHFYGEECAGQGIDFHHAIHLPEPLPVNYDDFLIAFCNAVENAINACGKLPEGRRRAIQIDSASVQNHFVFIVANTYVPPVLMDPTGQHPITHEAGHGFGTRSILAFAQKYGMLVNYAMDDEWFTLTWSMPLPEKERPE